MELMSVVASYANFSEDNNPHGERDFGPFDWRGTRCYWKIDYYDRQTDSASPEPSEPGVTCRVLTILRADEYLSAKLRGRGRLLPNPPFFSRHHPMTFKLVHVDQLNQLHGVGVMSIVRHTPHCSTNHRRFG